MLCTFFCNIVSFKKFIYFYWVIKNNNNCKQANLGNILFNNCSVFFFSMSSCEVLSLINSSKLFEYFSNIWNIVSTKFTFLKKQQNINYFPFLLNQAINYYLPWLSFLNKSWTALKSGLISACSAQHWRIILIASGGAAPLLTEGRIKGGGRLTFSIISVKNN